MDDARQRYRDRLRQLSGVRRGAQRNGKHRGKQVHALEQHVHTLLQQCGVDDSQAPAVMQKVKALTRQGTHKPADIASAVASALQAGAGSGAHDAGSPCSDDEAAPPALPSSGC